jgi:hypothetical protein
MSNDNAELATRPVSTRRLSNDWHDFMTKLDKYYPWRGNPVQMSFDYGAVEAHDVGKGL